VAWGGGGGGTRPRLGDQIWVQVKKGTDSDGAAGQVQLNHLKTQKAATKFYGSKATQLLVLVIKILGHHNWFISAIAAISLTSAGLAL